MKAFGFDLGDTLVEYEGLPLSWEAHYAEALLNLASHVGIRPSKSELLAAADILRKYNTRLHPRVAEVSFETILAEILVAFRIGPVQRDGCAEAFFECFRQRLRCFEDTIPMVERFIGRGWKIGIFTDVPYGMPRPLVLRDIREAGITLDDEYIFTSLEVGYRKPSPKTLATLVQRLQCSPIELVYVGNERKDIEVANAFGCESVLLDRGGLKPEWGQSRTIKSLNELE